MRGLWIFILLSSSFLFMLFLFCGPSGFTEVQVLQSVLFVDGACRTVAAFFRNCLMRTSPWTEKKRFGWKRQTWAGSTVFHTDKQVFRSIVHYWSYLCLMKMFFSLIELRKLKRAGLMMFILFICPICVFFLETGFAGFVIWDHKLPCKGF